MYFFVYCLLFQSFLLPDCFLLGPLLLALSSLSLLSFCFVAIIIVFLLFLLSISSLRFCCRGFFQLLLSSLSFVPDILYSSSSSPSSTLFLSSLLHLPFIVVVAMKYTYSLTKISATKLFQCQILSVRFS